MSKITDELDAAGQATVAGSARPPEACAASRAEALAVVARGLAEGSSSGIALETLRVGWVPSEEGCLLAVTRAGEVSGIEAREGSYRGHPVLVPQGELGLQLVQALALLEGLPLGDLAAEERARWLGHAAGVAAAESRAQVPAAERLDLDRLDSLLDAPTPPRALPDDLVPELAVALDATGEVAALAASGGLPLVVLRSGRPFLAASLGGDVILGGLTLVTRLLDEGRPLVESVGPAEGWATAAVLLDDALSRTAAVAGCPDGGSRVAQPTGTTSDHP